MSLFLQRAKARLSRRPHDSGPDRPPEPDPNAFPVDAWTDPSYEAWFEAHRATEDELGEQRRSWERLSVRPLFSFIVPLYRTPLDYLEDVVSSVLSQTYPELELVLVNASPELEGLRAALGQIEKSDERVKVVPLTANLGITENTNEGLAHAAGDFCCFLDHDDLIEPNLLFEYVSALNEHPDIDVLYCDEDMVEARADESRLAHKNPLFKPSYSPELLLCKNYVIHLMTIRRSLINTMPRPDARFDGSQDFNMILWCTSRARRVHGVQKVLYHWRISESSTATNPSSKPYSLRSCRLAIQGQLRREGIPASIIGSGIFNLHVPWFRDASDSVSVVVACGTDVALTRRFCEALTQAAGDRALQVVLSGCAHASLASEFPSLNISCVPETAGKPRTVRLSYGAALAAEAWLLFADEGCTFMTPEPLEQLIGLCSLRGVGAVAPKVLYADSRVKTYGVAVTRSRIMPLYRGYEDGFPGYQCNLRALQDVSALPLQGLLTRRATFNALGGFRADALADELMAVEYCTRLRASGLRCAVTPTVKVQVAESCTDQYFDRSQNSPDYPDSALPWFDELHPDTRQAGDPYLNPNLDQSSPYLQIPRLR